MCFGDLLVGVGIVSNDGAGNGVGVAGDYVSNVVGCVDVCVFG